MANYLTTDSELTSVANAIRAKGGTSAQLAYPFGFISAISNIPTGSSELVGISQDSNGYLVLDSASHGDLPLYLGHYTFEPTENVRTVSVPIGTDKRVCFISSNITTTGSVTSIIYGIISLQSSGEIYSQSRLYVITTAGALSYYTPTSSGANWSYSDGVLTIETTSGWYFRSGEKYDFFFR